MRAALQSGLASIVPSPSSGSSIMQFLSGDPPARPVRYDVRAVSGPGLLNALLAPFSRRGLDLDLLRARRYGDVTVAEITVTEMPSVLLAGCEADLRRVIGVLQVSTMLHRAAIPPSGPGITR